MFLKKIFKSNFCKIILNKTCMKKRVEPNMGKAADVKALHELKKTLDESGVYKWKGVKNLVVGQFLHF